MYIEKSVKAVEVVALGMDPPIVMGVAEPVKEVIRRMREAQTGCAMVCQGSKLSGIFTERDVLNKVVGVQGMLDRPVSDVMTLDPDTVHEDEPIRNAVLAMHGGGFRNVPIVDSQGRVVNCVRHKDIVHYLVEHFAQTVLNLPPDPEKMPETPDGG